MKLLNNFYQISGPALTHTFDSTGYLINTKQGLYLIDCGTPEGYELCLDNIRSLGFDPVNIKAIFGTHGHFDHVGAAALFKRDFGCGLYLHRDDGEQVEKGDNIATTADPLYGSQFPPCKVDKELKDGDILELGDLKMEVIHTPGHTPGSVCLVLTIDSVVVLVAGDTIYGGFASFIKSNEDDWRNSLDKLCARHYDHMTFGHTTALLMSDADARLESARASFANYYNPWFKNFKDKYRY
jgi:metallo-beta-lactamase class B